MLRTCATRIKPLAKIHFSATCSIPITATTTTTKTLLRKKCTLFEARIPASSRSTFDVNSTTNTINTTKRTFFSTSLKRRAVAGVTEEKTPPPPPPPKSSRKGPHPLALLAVASVGVSFYLVLVRTRGGPGSGKGTQSENLVKDFGFIHLSAGDLLRIEKERPGSKYGDLIDRLMKAGEIVPMEITIALLEQAMRESGGKRFLIDGFPRKMDQAMKFEEDVVEAHSILYFDCPEEVMLERLLNRGKTSGRVDDNIDSIRKRFITFKQQSYPVVEYYQRQGKVHSISCVDSPELVYQKVKKIFNEEFNENK
ncbi:4322_t:CDS:2 [Ambispora leptoticha]|uniref:Uridylate kinase n=1 Tax=Ambispora leptoticha TaxID=144679 RepID=A0A9N8YYN2_9GLOM|nr:4322_t:CDS:2 [Ambispora leptoticha]